MNIFKKIAPRSNIGILYVGFVAVCSILSVTSGVTSAVLDRVLDN